MIQTDDCNGGNKEIQQLFLICRIAYERRYVSFRAAARIIIALGKDTNQTFNTLPIKIRNDTERKRAENLKGLCGIRWRGFYFDGRNIVPF